MSRNAQPEAALQKTIVQSLAIMAIDGLWFAVPNGGYRARAEAAILAGLGVRPGVGDIGLIWRAPPIAPLWMAPHLCGVGFLEVKAPGASAEPKGNQKIFRDDCLRFGVGYAVVRSLEEVERALTAWNVPRARDAFGRFLERGTGAGEGSGHGVGSMGQRAHRRGGTGRLVPR